MEGLLTKFKRRFKARGIPRTVAITLLIAGFPIRYTSSEVVWVSDLFIAIGIAIIIGILWWPDRIPPRRTSFKKARVIWGLWYTGRGTRLDGVIEKYPDKVKKILLLNPESDGFKENMKETGGYDKAARFDIICLTRIAMKLGIPVRWYNTMQPRSLTFYNPEDVSTKKSRLISLVTKRYYDVDDRPLKKYTEKVYEYSDNLELFKDIWDNQSCEPNISEGDTNDEKRTKG